MRSSGTTDDAATLPWDGLFRGTRCLESGGESTGLLCVVIHTWWDAY